MSKGNNGLAGRWARAPFGRIGEALGFRWIMPIGTLPLPFHPWIARLLPWLVPALVLHRIVAVASGGDRGVTWFGLAVAAAALAIPMSIPIVSWIAAAFRAPLLQGLLIAGAMVLVAVDAVRGAIPIWWAALPLAWAGLYLFQRIAGPICLRRIEAANAAFERCVPGRRRVLFPDAKESEAHAGWLAMHCDVPRVAVEAKPAERREPAREDPPIRVRVTRHRPPLWILGGERNVLEIDDGERVRRLVGGEAALVGGLPLFVCFYWLAIFGGRSQWVVGFVRRKPVSLGSARAADLLARAFPARTAEAADAAVGDTGPKPVPRRSDPMAGLRAEARALLDRLLDPGALLPNRWPALERIPDVAHGRGRELCACLAAAQAAKRTRAVYMAAELISRLPADEFLALADELLTLLDSKELAFRLLDSDDPAVHALPEQERREHVVGGYSLVGRVPALYERLAELGEPARPLIVAMGKLRRWPPALATARDRLDRKAQ